MARRSKPANVTAIPLARRLPGASSNLPERLARTDLGNAPAPFLFGLAPGGVCRAAVIADKRGALLPHRFTLTAAKTLRSRGGLFSVALSLKLPRRAAPPDVIRHRSSMEPGLSSPAAFRHWRGAAVRPTDTGGMASAPGGVKRAGQARLKKARARRFLLPPLAGEGCGGGSCGASAGRKKSPDLPGGGRGPGLLNRARAPSLAGGPGGLFGGFRPRRRCAAADGGWSAACPPRA